MPHQRGENNRGHKNYEQNNERYQAAATSACYVTIFVFPHYNGVEGLADSPCTVFLIPQARFSATPMPCSTINSGDSRNARDGRTQGFKFVMRVDCVHFRARVSSQLLPYFLSNSCVGQT